MISRKKKSFSQQQVKAIVKDYTEGVSLQSLADEFKCSINPIRRILRESNVVFRGRGELLRSVQSGKKTCSSCKDKLDVESFYIKGDAHNTGYVSYSHACKTCMQDKAYKEWDKHVSRKFGLSADKYNDMVNLQKSLCAICGRPEKRILEDKPKRLSVDHCHATGKVRGLLCNQCNSLLGMAEDNPQILANAIAYLEKHK